LLPSLRLRRRLRLLWQARTPNCGSDNVQFALNIEEFGDDPLIVALTKMAENDTKD
jgi:hypothetical protein